MAETDSDRDRAGPEPGRPPFGPRAAAPLLRISGVSKQFGGHTAVDAVDLDIPAGGFFALLGPSGCGKTTLLRMIAGFETPDAGHILLDGVDQVAIPPWRRPVNMMFQAYALFPHLSVAGNIAFGLKQARLPRAEIARRVEEMLALVRLDRHADRRPQHLSGGERQRVALARALARRPRLLLLDEPLAALDKKLRGETQFELTSLRARLGTTFLVVTHDQEEAMTMADCIAVMDRGRLVQVAPPQQLYEQPASRWVADFIGDVNLFAGRLVEAAAGRAVIETGSVGRLIVAVSEPPPPGSEVTVAVRPEKLRMSLAPPPGGDNILQGRVADVAYLGGVSRFHMALNDGPALKIAVVNTSRALAAPAGPGDPVWASFAPQDGVLLTR